jgi:hypothetical protein
MLRWAKGKTTANPVLTGALSGLDLHNAVGDLLALVVSQTSLSIRNSQQGSGARQQPGG